MKLSAYLSPSRHGVYYFRFPLPRAENDRRRTVRVTLRTKCPDRAGDLARYLASCGRLVRDNKTLARLRQDQMRDMVRSYFVASLDRYTEKLNDTGLSEQSLDLLRQELAVHEDAISGTDDLSDLYLDPDDFRASTGLTDAEWAENVPDLRRKMRKTRRDQIKALLSRAESLEGHSFAEPSQIPATPLDARSASLGDAYADFMAEHMPQWSDQMAGAQHDGIWFLNITDDGDNKNRVKANASRRKVPIHSELIRLGFLDWVTKITQDGTLNRGDTLSKSQISLMRTNLAAPERVLSW